MTFWGDFAGSLAGTLVGGGILAVLLKELSARYIEYQLDKALAEHQHGLNEKLAALGASMLHVNDVLSRRNEREFEVVAGAWERMIKAVGLAQNEFGTGRSVPSFRMMNDEDARLLISGLPFREDQKQALLAASCAERDDL